MHSEQSSITWAVDSIISCEFIFPLFHRAQIDAQVTGEARLAAFQFIVNKRQAGSRFSDGGLGEILREQACVTPR